MRRAALYIVLGVIVIAALFLGRRFLSKPAQETPVSLETVQRRDIIVTVDATGTVEPVSLVEVKSKASGQIVRMPVEVGSVVRPGDLLAQIDSADVRNQYDQALASLRAAKAKVEVSEAQKKRADILFDQQIATAPEHEAALLDFANAQSQLVTAQTNLDIARQRLADATVRAPVAGTVIQKPVSVGQVISSATSSVSGGTTLLQMANLRLIRIRALVSESDIGGVRAGQAATVQVDAYPKRSFQGQVEKIEPQAVVQQSVTMFPVLVSISNEEGLLLPGMNGEVTVLVQERDDVVSVSLDAVRTVREIPAVAAAVGANADSVRSKIRSQLALAREPEAGGAQRNSTGRDSTAGRRRWQSRGASGDSQQDARVGSRRGGGRPGAGRSAPGGGGAAGSRPSGNTGAFNRDRQTQFVFVKTARGLEPRVVRLGLSNFDYAEILGGVAEGDEVALLGVAELQAQRNQNINRLRQRMGSGVPGVGGTGAGGSGGGGRRGGS